MAEKRRVRPAAKQPAVVELALGRGPVARVLQMFGNNPPAIGAEETLQAYSRMPWLRAINDKIGGAFSSLRWRAFVKVEPGEKGKRKIRRDPALQNAGFEIRNKELRALQETGELIELPDHPILTALYNEGENFSGVTLRELSQKYLDLVGEAFWIKIRNSDDMPVEFLPVPPHWVDQTPTTDNPYFVLNPPETLGRYDKKVSPRDMIWFYHPDPFNPYKRGIGMGTTLGDELETDEYAAKFLKSFFYNQARPDFLIHGDELEREDTIRLEQRWMDKLRGVFRGFTPFFSNRKLEVTRLTADYGHLQMLDLRAAQRDVCLQVYGAQPEIFGITEASNRATSEVAEYLFSRWVIVPRAEFFRAVMQIRLVPDFDERIILTYDSPIMQDKEHELKVAMAAPWSISLDEWREMVGKRPLPDGLGANVYCKPLNYEFFDITKAEGEPEEPEEPAMLPAGDEGDDGTPPEEDTTDPPEDEVEEAIRDEFYAYLEESRGIAWVSVREMEEHLESGDIEAISQMLAGFLAGHSGIDREIQKLMMRHGMKVAASMERWCPKNVHLEHWGVDAHAYVKDGTPIINEFIENALIAVENHLPRLRETMSPRKAVETVAINLGLSDEQWGRALDDSDPSLFSELRDEQVREFPVRLVSDALSFSQLQIVKDAIKNGYLAKRHIKRTWLCHKLDEIYDECREMHGHSAAGSDCWESPSGDMVVLPTRSRPDCHCREKLVVNGGEV